MRYIISALIVSILMLACQKQFPSLEEQQPVFYFKGKINGQEKNIYAGVADYYMFTNYQSTNIASANLYRLTGTLASTTCSGCESLTIELNDNELRLESYIPTISDVLYNGGFTFLTTIDSTQNIEYQFTGINGYNSYLWTFGDGTNSTVQNPTHVFLGNGIYNVCLTAMDTLNGCTLSSCNEINVSQSPEYDLTFTYDLQQNTLNLSTPSAGWTPLSWTLNDTLISTGFITTAYLNPNAFPEVKVCLTASKNSVTKTFCRALNIPGITTCSADWTYSSMIDTSVSQDLFSKVRITYIGNDGKVYVSDKQTQDASSYFNINSVEDYSNNEFGIKTKKISCSFKAILFSTLNTSEYIIIESNKSFWGLAYP